MLTLNTGNQVPVDLEIVCIHPRYGGDGDVIGAFGIEVEGL